MDASCTIQDNIHLSKLNIYVSRILGTHHFAVMILGNLPPLSMIEGAFLKYFGIPVAFTWFMSTKTFDGKKPYGFLKSVIAYALRPKLTYAGKKVTLGRNQPQEAITAVRSEFYGISN